MPKNCLNCPVEIVEDVFGASDALARLIGERKVLLVADSNVVQRTEGLGTRIGAYVRDHGLTLAGAPIVMGGGERIKMDNFQSASRVVEAALAAELEREDFILALGGGTILDVAGWAAAQVRGGVRLVRVPTTPAALLGAAFAETAALNTPQVKDAYVVPSVPTAVLLDCAFASTVLDGVWRAGLSEAVRLAAAHDAKVLTKLAPLAETYQAREGEVLATVVAETLALRKKKGATDLGLVSAAELEPKSGWKLPHGYAVAIGTLIELSRMAAVGVVSEKVVTAAQTILKQGGALDGARHSQHILPPEFANFW